MKQILKYYVRVIMFLYPLFYLPIVLDPYGFGKVWFLMLGGLIGLVLWTINLLLEKKGIVKYNRFFWLILMFTVWSLISWFRLPVGARVSSFMSQFGLGMMLSLFVWFFLWLQVTDKGEFKKQLGALTFSGLVLLLLSVVTFLIPVSKLPINLPNSQNPLLSIVPGWSLTGSILGEMVLFLIIAIDYLKRLLTKLKKREVYIVEAIFVAIFVLASFLSVYKIFTFGWVNMDFFSSWNIAVETFKGNVIKGSTIFGVGPGNFLTAFNLFRPASYNLTRYWANTFSLSSMGLLHIWTELGITGLLLLIFGVLGFIKKIKEKDVWMILIYAALTIFLPLDVMVLFILFWLISHRSGEVKEARLILNLGENNFNVLPYLISLVLLAGVVYGGYWQYKVLMGDITMRKSLLYAIKDDGTNTYNTQIRAITYNPYLSSFRRTYSQTNLGIAGVLLQNENISEEDKQKAATLIQQSVDQAKQAINLNRFEAINWQNLAVIYKQLIGLVDGTADWSYQAYQQATVLDPVNPVTRLDMGGLLFAAQRYEDAGRVFEQVVKDKMDYANAWYNLAYADKAQNKLEIAVADLQQALSLVSKDSGDYEKANQELDAWKKELEEAIKKFKEQQAAEQQVKEPETLKAPQAIPTAGEQKKVEVPASEMEPPEAPIMPTETPEVTSSPEAENVSPALTE